MKRKERKKKLPKVNKPMRKTSLFIYLFSAAFDPDFTVLLDAGKVTKSCDGAIVNRVCIFFNPFFYLHFPSPSLFFSFTILSSLSPFTFPVSSNTGGTTGEGQGRRNKGKNKGGRNKG
jgi:hypothetical protein